MGGLPALNTLGSSGPRLSADRFRQARWASLLSLLVTTGCEDKKVTPPLAPQARSQGVAAASAAAPPATEQPAGGAAEPPKEHMVLCDHQLGKPPKEVPKASLSRAGQQSELPEKLPVGGGHWTWINLWAAWCGPCKEEIPRLRSWEAKSAGERVPLKVAFVSIDDDGRQLETFLGSQPPGGLHATYWLRDGQERLAWLKEAGLDSEPELPAQLLVDPQGKVRCTQQCAWDHVDGADLLKILCGE